MFLAKVGSKLVSAGSTARNHWKKTVFFCVASGYGANWYMQKLENDDLMAKCCREALSFGVTQQAALDQNYHVTVILNPAASGGKGRKLFEKYSAPLLHLAGIKVSVQLTEGREEAKQLMTIMNNTDAVLVAGGDGTLMEAVTGFLRREDAETCCKIPLGVIPVGENNTLAGRLFPGADQVKQLTEATMSVIKQLKRPLSVFEVENLSKDPEFYGKKIYAFNGLEFGAWREAYNRRDRYWLFAGLKHRLAFVFSYFTAHKEINWDWPLKLDYTTSEVVTRQIEEKPHGIFARFSSPKIVEKTETVNTWHKGTESTVSQLDIKLDEKDKVLNLKTYPTQLLFSDFFGHGLSRLKNEESPLEPQEWKTKELKLETEVVAETPRCMSIDGEEVEIIGPLRVAVVPDKITMFCRSTDAVQEPTATSTSAASRWSTGIAVNSAQLMASRQRF